MAGTCPHSEGGREGGRDILQGHTWLTVVAVVGVPRPFWVPLIMVVWAVDGHIVVVFFLRVEVVRARCVGVSGGVLGSILVVFGRVGVAGSGLVGGVLGATFVVFGVASLVILPGGAQTQLKRQKRYHYNPFYCNTMGLLPLASRMLRMAYDMHAQGNGTRGNMPKSATACR